MNMENLYLLEKINYDYKKLKMIDGRIIVFDLESHVILNKFKIKHDVIDCYIQETERRKFFPFAKNLVTWYEKITNNDVIFNGINLMSLIDRNELLEIIMDLISKINAVKNILEINKYNKIYATDTIYKILRNNQKTNIILFDKNEKSIKLSHDEVLSPIEIGPIKFDLKISRKKILQLKNQYEKIIGKILKFTINDEKIKKIILLEMNPEIYHDLLKEFKKNNIQPILINFRRPATISLKSIKILKETNSVVVNPEELIDTQEFKKLQELKNELLHKINNRLIENSNQYKEIFQYDKIKFDELMINLIKKIFNDRMHEYMVQILLSKKISEFDNVLGIICLNLSGETENIFSHVIDNYPIILLQHAFSNYNDEFSHIDILDDYDLIKNKIAIYGNLLKNYLTTKKSIPENKIIVCGSPKYDSYFNYIKPKNNTKKILITPRPIINHIDGVRISLYHKYEKIMKNIVRACKKNENIEVIFKLHPQQHPHNDMIKKIIQKNFPGIKIYQDHSIKNLLLQSDLHINIASDNFDVSTVILEAMILNCPTLNIQLQNTEFNFECIQMNAIRSINDYSNLEFEISELIYNDEKRNKLLKNSSEFLNLYLSNQGNASNSLIYEIINLDK